MHKKSLLNIIMQCEECLHSPGSLLCEECEERLCAPCDALIHKGGKRKAHARRPLCHCGTPAENTCEKCESHICANCQYEHAGHILEPLAAPKRATVFWDLSSCRPCKVSEVALVVRRLRECFEVVDSLRGYGELSAEFRAALLSSGVVLESRSGMKETHALLLDMSILASRGLTYALVLSEDVGSIRPHLMQLAASLPKLQIIVALRLAPLSFVTIESLVEEREESTLEQCSVLQHCFQSTGRDRWQDALLLLLKDWAAKGLLMHDLALVKKTLGETQQLNPEQTSSLLKAAGALGTVSVSDRKFGSTKTMSFVSLRLESTSLESLCWVLRSLKNDEMLPTERAIQSRMKEAFDFKPSTVQWLGLLQACRGPTQSSGAPEYTLLGFVDPVTGRETQLIYPKGEHWDGLDQYIKAGDALRVKNTAEWDSFISFLEGYFVVKGCTEESKALAGGRYGCAQFLKVCGPPPLRNCSLGKLVYMVQLAINEDLFRYHKTLLLWSPATLKRSPDSNAAYKLRIVQRAVLDILKENRAGVSLAQLPLNLKKKLVFSLELGELGFAKLKDLLGTLPEVAVEPRESHPFAVLKRFLRCKDTEVKRHLDSLLAEHSLGLPGSYAESLLSARMGHSVHWSDYHCSSIYEFVNKNASADMDVFLSADSGLLIRAKQRRSQSLAAAHKQELSTDHSKSSSSSSEVYSQQKGKRTLHLPGEIPQQESGVIDFENEERSRNLIESVLCDEDEFSATLHGERPPRIRSDSIEFHSSAGSFESTERHSNRSSQDFRPREPSHSRKVRSYYEGFSEESRPGLFSSGFFG